MDDEPTLAGVGEISVTVRRVQKEDDEAVDDTEVRMVSDMFVEGEAGICHMELHMASIARLIKSHVEFTVADESIATWCLAQVLTGKRYFELHDQGLEIEVITNEDFDDFVAPLELFALNAEMPKPIEEDEEGEAAWTLMVGDIDMGQGVLSSDDDIIHWGPLYMLAKIETGRAVVRREDGEVLTDAPVQVTQDSVKTPIFAATKASKAERRTHRDEAIKEVQPEASRELAKPRDPRLDAIEGFDEIVALLAREMAKLAMSKHATDVTSLQSFSPSDDDERSWLADLSSSGVYHSFKERLKPRAQKLARTVARDKTNDKNGAFMGHIYAELLTCATVAANRRFRDAESKLEPPALPPSFSGADDDDAKLTSLHRLADQELRRLYDAEAVGSGDSILAQRDKVLAVCAGFPPQLRVSINSDLADTMLRCAVRRVCAPADAEDCLREAPHKSLELAALLLEIGRVDDAEAALAQAPPAQDDDKQRTSYILHALVADAQARGLDCRSCLDQVASSPKWRAKRKWCELSRLRVCAALEGAEWLCRRGMARCARRLVEMAREADKRAIRHAEMRHDDARRMTPPWIRSKVALETAFSAVVLDELAAESAVRDAILRCDDGEAWLLQSMFAPTDAHAAVRALATLAKRPLWLFMRVVALATDRDIARNAAFEACVKYPKQAVAWRTAGNLLLEAGDFERAEQMLEEANVLDKENALTWGLLALANLGQYTLGDTDRIDLAAKILEQALLLGLRDSELLACLASRFRDLDRLDLAASLFERAERFIELARVHVQAHNYVEAATVYATLVDQDPSLRPEYASCLAKLGREAGCDDNQSTQT